MEYTMGDLNQENLKEVWNNKQYKKLRAEMISGKEPESCKRCFEQESVGKNSFREDVNEKFRHLHYLFDKTKPNGSLDYFKLYYWDFRFSNICNMRCRSCGPQLSTGWYEDTKKLWGGLPQDIPDSEPKFDMWKEIEPFFPDVESIYFAGGEPLIMEEHYKILEKLDELEKYDTHISYNTNFSRLTYKKINAVDVWSKFKNVEIGASIDGFGKKAEYIRKGTDWNKIEANRKELKRKAPNVDFWINFTLSVYNSYHVIEFYNWAVDSGFIKPDKFHINLVQFPEHLRLQILPTHIKKDLTREYKKLAEVTRKRNIDHLADQFDSITNFMWQEDRTDLQENFKKYTLAVDKIREENFETVFPELEQLLR
jgi:MoaA/NifB/PqqE/SkfB family radical SAM enzyme